MKTWKSTVIGLAVILSNLALAHAKTGPVPTDQYAHTARATQWVIPTSANVRGRFGGTFKTRGVVFNPDPNRVLDVTLRLYDTGGLARENSFSVGPLNYVGDNDVLANILDYQGAGALVVVGSHPFMIASVEVYIDTANGRSTTVIMNRSTPFTASRVAALSVGITVNEDYRTNIGVFNASDQPQTITAQVYASGAAEDLRQTITFHLPPNGWSQKSVSARVEEGYIIWQIPLLAYPYVVGVDNVSNDGTLTVPMPLE